MKGARERVEEAWASLGLLGIVGHVNLDAYSKWARETELSFKEHARDQRHLCAEATQAALVNFRHKADAHAAVLNAPAPGE